MSGAPLQPDDIRQVVQLHRHDIGEVAVGHAIAELQHGGPRRQFVPWCCVPRGPRHGSKGKVTNMCCEVVQIVPFVLCSAVVPAPGASTSGSACEVARMEPFPENGEAAQEKPQ